MDTRPLLQPLSIAERGLFPLVVLTACILRFWALGEWSLWEDEETTIYFSQNLDKWFAKVSPVYFHPLAAIYELAGVSVWTGRAYSAVFGIATVIAVYYGTRMHIGHLAAVTASALLTVNLGHLFWSQSIRYYAMALFFQSASMFCFLHGFERRKPVCIVASSVLWALALLSHMSAILLAPVYVAYAALSLFPLRGKRQAIREHVVALVVFGVVAAGFLSLWNFVLQTQVAIQGDSEYSSPTHILLTIAAYFGIPVIALAAVGTFLSRSTSVGTRQLLALGGSIPVAELIVIAQLKLVPTVTWYYGLVALVPLCCLSGLAIEELSRRRRVWTLFAALGVAFAYYGVFVAAYFGPMHGDRPRWREGVEFVREQRRSADAADAVEIFATVPGVVEFYLGVDPARTMNEEVVKAMPSAPPAAHAAGARWFLVKASHVTPEYDAWFRKHCVHLAGFEAKTGPRDRTVHVYYSAPSRRER